MCAAVLACEMYDLVWMRIKPIYSEKFWALTGIELRNLLITGQTH
jgi:hypothetical protein